MSGGYIGIKYYNLTPNTYIVYKPFISPCLSSVYFRFHNIGNSSTLSSSYHTLSQILNLSTDFVLVISDSIPDNISQYPIPHLCLLRHSPNHMSGYCLLVSISDSLACFLSNNMFCFFPVEVGPHFDVLIQWIGSSMHLESTVCTGLSIG